MADPRSPEADDATGMEAHRPPPGMPRWLKVSGIILAVLIVLLVILALTGVFGQHGPGRHGV
jgi:hypothetical protein